MTISSQTRKAGPFVGNGTVATFPFTFKVFQASDLQLVKLNSTTNVETQLVLTTDYTVSLNANQNTNPGGTITLTAGVLPTGYKLTITTNVAPLQAVDLTNSGGFYPSVINAALDKLTILVQQIIERAGRTLTLPLSTSADVSTSLPAPQANAFIGWDQSGKALQNYDNQALATVVAYGTAKGDIFTGDGSTTQFNLTNNPGALNNLDVSVGGVTQLPGVDYSWDGGTLVTFVDAPASGVSVFVRYMQGLPFGHATAADVTYDTYTVKDQLDQTVEYARYLAAPSATPTSAFNAAVSALMAGGGGRLKIKAGSYSLALDQIVVNVPNLVIEGDGMYATHLVFPKAAGTAMKFDGGNRVFFKDIHVTGYDGTGNYFATSSIGIDTAADIIGENAWFDGFANLFNWRGGYYHRFYGCRFNKAQYCFKGFSANNFQLHAPRIAEVDYVGDFNSGSGPVVVLGGSIEKWTSTAFSTSGGARPHIAIIGTYIENYPSVAAGNGLAKSFYQGAFLTSGFGSIALMSGMGSLNGIRRLVANGGIDTRSIVSIGNEWQYQKGAGSDTDYFFVYQNLENGFFRDSLRNNITGQTGGYTPAYRAGSMLKPEAVTGYDPIADAVIYNEPAWTIATLLNGWANSDATNYESASFKKIGNRVFLRGYITGASATGSTILTLPAGYYDDKYNLLATATLSGTPTAVALRVLNNGNITIQNTAYTTVGAFSLDGLSFFVD